jgi:isoquinoline 1-oxidoreductase beta subunit
MAADLMLSRREFVTASAAGASLIVGFRLPRPVWAAAARPLAPFAPNGWITIDARGLVTLVVDRSEMGQGAVTGMAMILAEELDADWSLVRLGEAPTDPSRWVRRMSTGGSASIRGSWDTLRQAGAAAREMLRAAAAQAWGVPLEECSCDAGTVVHRPTGRSLAYGQLVERAAGLEPPEHPRLKDPGEFRIIGRPMKRLDTPPKVDGRARFGIDVVVPNMLVASIERAPTLGGRVASYDDSAARAVDGVRYVVALEGTHGKPIGDVFPARVESGVAVVADSYWQAATGRRALEVAWDPGPHGQLGSEGIAAELRRLAGQPGAVARSEGDVQGALRRAATVIEAEYQVPYLHHATMEPMNCVADVRADGCEIWAPTQTQSAAQDVAAKITGLPPEKIRVHTTFLGGGFGRRLETDYIAEAVLVSRAVGRPVKVVWTREDDVRHGFYRPATYNRFAAGLDAEGRPVAWSHKLVCPSILAFKGWLEEEVDRTSVEGAANLPYAIPNLEVRAVNAEIPVPLGFWRSVGSSHTAFVTECFLDEVAHAAGADPYEFRRSLLTHHARHRRVLEVAAERSGWGAPPPAGRARGIAVAESFGSFVAQVAEVSVEAEAVRVHRVTCVVDCGPYVNPDGVQSQMEGGIVFGLTAALHGEITLERGRVQQSNFHDYPMLRLRDMPEVDVHIVPSTEEQGGIGEPGVPPIAPAVCNAVFAATGRRVRKLPIRLV